MGIIQKIVFILFSFYLFTTSEQIQVERFEKNYQGKALRSAKSVPLIQKEWRKLRTSVRNNRRKRVKKTTMYVDKENKGIGKKVDVISLGVNKGIIFLLDRTQFA